MYESTSPSTENPEINLLIPGNDVVSPEFTILIPALNEEITIELFIDWCKEGIAKAGCACEILIVDSSTDRTPEMALEKGARVLKTPKRGLSRAYRDAIPFVRGQYVIMGDADCTYDFRYIEPFVEKLREGNEFVMGSRFKGSIEKGAMPFSHQYFGTPVTTFILNVIFGSRFSDIHCGMRGVSLDALIRMDLSSETWEYASEMIIKSIHMKLKTAEVPIHFLKDFEGHLSHMKRAGLFEPWRAGWQNLRGIFTYGVDFFLFKPGLFFLALGLMVMLPMTFGKISIGPFGLSTNWMLLAMSTATIGLSMTFFGALAQLIFDYTGAATSKWGRLFPYNRTLIFSVILVLIGVFLATPLLRNYIDHDFTMPGPIGVDNYRAVMGLWLIISGFQVFVFMLLRRAISMSNAIRQSGDRIGPSD